MNPDGTLKFRSNEPEPKVSEGPGLVPTADKVLIEPMKVEEQTKGGIVLATASLEKEQLAQTIGTVVSMGSTAKMCPEMEGIEIGDTVLFARYSGAEFPVNGLAYRIMRARDVIGKATRLPDSVIRGAQSSVDVFGQNNLTGTE